MRSTHWTCHDSCPCPQYPCSPHSYPPSLPTGFWGSCSRFLWLELNQLHLLQLRHLSTVTVSRCELQVASCELPADWQTYILFKFLNDWSSSALSVCLPRPPPSSFFLPPLLLRSSTSSAISCGIVIVWVIWSWLLYCSGGVAVEAQPAACIPSPGWGRVHFWSTLQCVLRGL